MQESASEIGSLDLEGWPQAALSKIQSDYKTIQG